MDPLASGPQEEFDRTIGDETAELLSEVNAGPQEIGDYQILEELGRGGMGVVLKARQRSLNRLVAIKMILGATFLTDTARQRFRREAELIAALNHPNIVDIYEIGEFESQPFYSMEYIEGTTLKELVKGTPLAWTQAARFAFVIAKAMQFAHERGVIHRDLKPQNIMVDRYQDVHITDFGTARDLTAESQLTISGAALGTPNYMSPEQCQSDAQVSSASDIYSIGAIIYELVTSIPPFVGTSIHDLLEKVRNATPVEPYLINHSIPRDLNTICLKCLQKDPARRYLTCGELADELDRVLKDMPIRAKPVSPLEKGWRWCRRNRLLASVIFVSTVAIIAAAIVAMIQAHDTRIALNETEIHREAAVALNLIDSSPPEALRLAFNASAACIKEFGAPFDDVQQSLTTALMRSNEIAEINPRYKKFERSAISADGRRVLMTGDGRLSLFDLQTGTRLFDISSDSTKPSTALAIDESGKIVARAGQDGTVRWWNDEGKLLGQLPPAKHGWTTALALSRDGRLLATAGVDRMSHVWTLAGVELSVHPVEPHANAISQLLFRPDGKAIVSADGGSDCTIQVRAIDGTLLYPAIPSPSGGTSCLAYSPDGQVLATGGFDFTARFWGSTGGYIGQTQYTGKITAIAFSPEGPGIAIAEAPNLLNSANPSTIHFVNQSGELQHEPLTATVVNGMVFAPGGNLAVADASVCRLESLSPLQTRAHIPLERENQNVTEIAVLPDGKTIVTGTAPGIISFLDFSGTKTAPDLKVPGAATKYARFELSPSGDCIGAFIRGESSVKIWQLDGSWQEQVTIDNQVPVDGFSFSIASNRVATSMGHQVWLRDLAGKLVATINADSQSLVNRLAFSPDGKILAGSTFPGYLPIWDPDGHEVARIDTGELGSVFALRFSPDGRFLAAAFESGFIALYDCKTFRQAAPLLQLGPNREGPNAIVFSPDSQRIVGNGCSETDALFQMWDVTGVRLTPSIHVRPYDASIIALGFTPDGRTLVTRGGYGIDFWAGDWHAWMDVAARRLQRHPIIQGDDPEAKKARAAVDHTLAAGS